MLRACVVCGHPSEEARCVEHRVHRQRGYRHRKQRQRIIERDNYQCVRCGVYLTGERDTHVDHVVALSAGGSEDDTNKQCLCQSCNQKKGAIL